MKVLGQGCAAVAAIALAVALSFGLLFWAGGLQWLGVGIQRQVNVQSQRYVEAHNREIAGLISDYTATNDPARRQAIVNQVCLLAGEIAGNVITTSQPFVAAHCA